jgi:hypothetical protein
MARFANGLRAKPHADYWSLGEIAQSPLRSRLSSETGIPPGVDQDQDGHGQENDGIILRETGRGRAACQHESSQHVDNVEI